MNIQKWGQIKNGLNNKFAYWRRFRNYMLQIQEVIDRPFTIPEHTFNQILQLSSLALEGNGEALEALKEYPRIVRKLLYEEKYG